MDGWAVISFTFKQLFTNFNMPYWLRGFAGEKGFYLVVVAGYFYLLTEQQLRVIDKTSDKPK